MSIQFVDKNKASELNRAQGGSLASRYGKHKQNGEQVELLKQNGDGQNAYIKIKTSSGQTGWVLASAIDLV